MKKKFLAIVMAGLILSVSGCSSLNAALEGASTGEVGKEEIVETESASSAQDAQNPEETDKEVTAVSNYLDVDFNYFVDSYYEEVSLMYGHYNSICLNSTEYPALTAAVEAYNEELEGARQSYLDELEAWATDEYKSYGADSFMGPFVMEADMYLRRADRQVLSVVEACYAYEGGAHGNQYYTSVNFDVQTGEHISLDSVIADMDSLPAVLATEVQEKYPDLTFWAEDLSTVFQDYITPSNAEYAPEFTWTVDYQGVTFYFSDYELGSYADGRQEVLISYTEYPELLNGTYFENVDDYYVIALLDNWAGTDLDLNGDGVTDYVSVHRNYNVDTEYCESLTVTVNGNAFTQDVYFYDLWSYFVKSGDNNYLYIQRVAESDYMCVSVFKLTENSVEYVGDFANSLEDFTNSASFKVAKRMDLLSTYFATADCTVGENGLPVEISDVYTIKGQLILTSTAVIPAELVDEEGLLLGETYEFPVGTAFEFVVTDGETYVDVLADDGQRCRFYTEAGWPPTVNEMNAENCFEMLLYAG